MVTTVQVAPGHEDTFEDAWQSIREELGQHAGFRGASLLRDSSRPNHYVVLTGWDGHDQLADAMRELTWLHRDLTTEWTAGPFHVYDQVVDSVGDTAEAGGTRASM
jgi:heme-degrading monooxygenase HmoA